MTMTALFTALLLQTAPAPAPATAPSPLDVQVPPIAGVTADPTCGGRPGMAAIATCLATTQVAIESAVDAYNTAFAAQGWIAAEGSENRIIYVRRKPEGGCDAFQLLAFADNMQSGAPAAPAYLALAAVPGDVCTASAQPAAPAQ